MKKYYHQLLHSVETEHDTNYTYLLVLQGKTVENIIYRVSQRMSRTELFDTLLEQLYQFSSGDCVATLSFDDMENTIMELNYKKLCRCLGNDFLSIYRIDTSY